MLNGNELEQNSELRNFLENYFIDFIYCQDHTEYLGIIKPSLNELFELKNVCEREIIRRMK